MEQCKRQKVLDHVHRNVTSVHDTTRALSECVTRMRPELSTLCSRHHSSISTERESVGHCYRLDGGRALSALSYSINYKSERLKC